MRDIISPFLSESKQVTRDRKNSGNTFAGKEEKITNRGRLFQQIKKIGSKSSNNLRLKSLKSISSDDSHFAIELPKMRRDIDEIIVEDVEKEYDQRMLDPR